MSFQVNFHNIYDTAHTAADFGGDVVTQYELDTDYIKLIDEWYVTKSSISIEINNRWFLLHKT